MSCWEALHEGSISTDEGLILLNEKLGVGWESDAQVKFRLSWLEDLGVVTQANGRWRPHDSMKTSGTSGTDTGVVAGLNSGD